MHQHMLQHRFTIGRHLWLCLTLALGLALGTQVVTARECQRETPLPADVCLVAPGPEVPEAILQHGLSRRRTSASHSAPAHCTPSCPATRSIPIPGISCR